MDIDSISNGVNGHSGQENSSSSIRPYTTGSASTTTSSNKGLPDIPSSNRKLLVNMKKSGRLPVQNRNWSSSFTPPVPYMPAIAPPGKLPLTQEKLDRLASILAESDSEDEKVVISKGISSSFGKACFFLFSSKYLKR